MVERSELITVCRQIGSMMEAGVDILRITRVMRAQTENPRLLQFYDALDHDLTMGRGVAEGLSRAPDVFSPFVVQMVQQGEARNDIGGAFIKVADFLQKELDFDLQHEHHHEHHHHHENGHTNGNAASVVEGVPATTTGREVAPELSATYAARGSTPLTVIALDGLMERLQTFVLRSLTVLSGLMLTLAGVWWANELGFLQSRWRDPVAFSVAAVFMGTAGLVIQRRLDANRRRESRCSFCGRTGVDLQRSPRFAGAAICAQCAAIAARGYAAEQEVNAAPAEAQAVAAGPASPQASHEAAPGNAAAPPEKGDEPSPTPSAAPKVPHTGAESGHTAQNGARFATQEQPGAGAGRVASGTGVPSAAGAASGVGVASGSVAAATAANGVAGDDEEEDYE